MNRSGLPVVLAWLGAVAVCLAVFGQGLDCWFQQDDFAWLGLRDEVLDWHSFLNTMFAPKAQGTIRPWSERGFFMGFRTLFDLDALPYRIFVFATQALNLWLLIAVTRRMTGSLAAAFFAAVFWGANASLGVPLAWTAAYNQILCSAFLLGAFYYLLRWLESGRTRHYVMQLVIFVFGFGALEHNIVFPAIAGAWVILAGRWRKLLWIAPLGAVSGVYLWIHNMVAPKAAATGPYALHTDAASLWKTLQWYLMNTTGGLHARGIGLPEWLETAGAAMPVLIGLALVPFLLVWLRRGEWTVLFPIAWFLILLAPVLPLRNHTSGYYLVMPVLGLSMLGGWAFSAALGDGWVARMPAIALAALYLITTGAVGREVVDYYHDISIRVRNLVFGVEHAHELHPGKVILLNGVDTETFWSGVNDRPFRLIGVNDIFLTPGSEANIQAFPDLGNPSDFVLPALQTIETLDRGGIVVYAAGGERLRNITRSYTQLARSSIRPDPAHRIDVGHPIFASQLGSGWFEASGGVRWMGKTAVVKLGASSVAGQRLHVEGYCPEEQISAGGVVLSLLVDGKPLLKQRIEAVGSFYMAAEMPRPLPGAREVEIRLEVDRTVSTPEDRRELGLLFGKLSVR